MLMIVVSRIPPVFRTALNAHNECGAYQLRAVLNAFGRDARPEELYWSDWMRRHDWSLPWFMTHILARYSTRSRWHFWLSGSFRKRMLAALEADMPVLFVIHSIRSSGRLHWVSAWGHDPATDEFLCYDSHAPMTEGEVGNMRYGADLLVSRLPWGGTFAVTIDTVKVSV
jgi:hypothetical protein